MKHHQCREPPNLHIIHKSQKQMHVQFCNVYQDQFLSHSPGGFFSRDEKKKGVVYMYINRLHLLYGTSSRMFVFSLFFFTKETCMDLSKFGTCIQHLQRCLFFHPVFTKKTCTDLPSKFGTCMQHLPRGLFFQPVFTEGTCTDLSSTFGTCMQHLSRGLFFHPVFTDETCTLIVHIWYMHATYLQRSVLSPSFHRGDLHGPIMDLPSPFGTCNTSKEIHSFAQFSQRKPAPTAPLMIQENKHT